MVFRVLFQQTNKQTNSTIVQNLSNIIDVMNSLTCHKRLDGGSRFLIFSSFT